jgi:excisionase family DNA binding protein
MSTGELAGASRTEAVLMTIEEAIGRYHGVTRAMVRAWIRRGEFPAVRAGKSYLIDPRDLEHRLRPTLRTSTARPVRESPTARAERQLQRAGIV